jgi:hypothetical protein
LCTVSKGLEPLVLVRLRRHLMDSPNFSRPVSLQERSRD